MAYAKAGWSDVVRIVVLWHIEVVCVSELHSCMDKSCFALAGEAVSIRYVTQA